MQPIPILAGPTGSKKTETAMALAEVLESEIISADSLQIYRYFDIGTAKPSQEYMKRIPHHLIDILEPDKEFSAFDFKTKALESIEDIISRGKTPLLVGGTGLYLKVLTEDYDCGVQIDPVIKTRIQEEIKTRGAPALHLELKEIDPVSAEKIPSTDPQRIERALSVFYQTNQKLSDLHQKDKSNDSDYTYQIFILEWEREILYKNINQRVDIMIERGLVQEVRSLLDKGWDPDLKPFQSIGYSQILDFINGQSSLENAIEKIKQETRRYAKRQITWFKKVPNTISIPVTPKDTPETLRDKIIPKYSQVLAIFLMIALLVFPKGAVAQKTQLQKAGQEIMSDRSERARSTIGKEIPQGKRLSYLLAVLDARDNKKSALEKLQASLKTYPEIEDYIRYELARWHETQKEFPLALNQIETLLKRFPQTALYPEAQQLRAKTLEALNKNSEAVQVLRDSLQSLPSKITRRKGRIIFPELKLHLAQLLVKLGKFEEADKVFKQILISHPDHANAEIAETERKKLLNKNFKAIPLTLQEKEDRLKALLKKTEYKKVLAEINAISSKTSVLPAKFYFFQARAQARLGRRAKAVEALQLYIKLYPDHKRVPEAMYKIARHQWNLGENKASNAIFAEITTKYATSKWAAKSHYILGRMDEDKKNFKQASEQYLHLAKHHLDTEDGQWAAWRIGWMHYLNKEYNQAFLRFEENSKSTPSGFYIVNNLYWQAKSALKLKDKKAGALFQSVYERFPYSYYGLRGLQESKVKKASTPIKTITLSKKVATDDEKQRVLRAKELTALGFFLYAREELKLLEKDIKKNLTNVVWLAKLYNEAGAYSDSVRLLQLYRNHVGKIKEKTLPIEYWKAFYPSVYSEIIHIHAEKNKVDPNFIKGLIKQESLYEEEALSVAGARGLMQIMPATGRRINSKQKTKVSLVEDDDLFDPEVNIQLGAAYLKQLEASTGKNKAYKLIAYNAGPRVLKKWKKRFKAIKDSDEFTESIPYPETRNYVKKVLRNYWLYKRLYEQP